MIPEHNLLSQAMECEKIGRSIGELAVKVRVQDWMIRHAKTIPEDAFLELRQIVGASNG